MRSSGFRVRTSDLQDATGVVTGPSDWHHRRPVLQAMGFRRACGTSLPLGTVWGLASERHGLGFRV